MVMKRVHIEMDQAWEWWIPSKDDPVYVYDGAAKTVLVDEELIEEFKIVSARYRELQNELERLYRKQEGMKPFSN